MRTIAYWGALAALAVGVGVSPVMAQRGPGHAPPQREALERQLGQRSAELVKRRLNLTDEQMTKLQATNRQFARERMDLLARERDTRRALRQEILAEDKANQARVGELLDRILEVERQRLELVQNEQREIAKFLTPVQRAKLLGLQTEMRRRAQGAHR